jgi:recombination protein RecA
MAKKSRGGRTSKGNTKSKKKKLNATDKDKLINNAITGFKKTFGDDSVEYVFKNPPPMFIPCTNLAINFAVSGGRGFPTGRILEFLGESSSGKSLLLYDLIAQVQAQGGYAFLADNEKALDPLWARKNGISDKRLLNFEPVTIEEFFKMAFGEGTGTKRQKGLVERIRAKDPDSPIIVGCDSVAALTTQAELEAEFGKADMGGAARKLSQAFRKIVKQCEEMNVMLVMLNQTREKIGVRYGNPETSPGGKALRFYSTITVHFANPRKLMNTKGKLNLAVGVKPTIRIEKNRLARPFMQARVNILFDSGLTKYSGLLNTLTECGIITREKGKQFYRWSKYRFTRKKFRKFVDKHPEILKAAPPELLEGDELYDKLFPETETGKLENK